MAQIIEPAFDPGNVGANFGSGLVKGYQNRSDEMAIQKAISELPKDADPRTILDALTNAKTYSPQAKQTAVLNYLKGSELSQKSATPSIKANAAAQKKADEEETKKRKQAEIAELTAKVSAEEGFNDLKESEQYDKLVEAGVPPIDAERRSKLRASEKGRETSEFDKSYDSQKKFIDDTTNRYRAFTQETEPKLKLLTQLANDDEKLIGPVPNEFRKALGIPLGALDNPNNELFEKTSLDLLKGLPESYGNRILKVEVDNFLKTIPSLENSAAGRKMIASNLLKLGEMKKVYYNEMRGLQEKYIKEGKFPKDFEQKVLDQVKPQLDKLSNEFLKLSEIKSVPPGTTPFFNPNGDIEFVPENLVQWAETEGGGKRIW